MSTKTPRAMYLSVEETWRLCNALRPVEDAFGGHYLYIVGSVLYREDWRDVDLRLILPDDEFARLFDSGQGLFDQFRMLLQTSISAMLRQTTYLPIDFQVQSHTESLEYSDRKRNLARNRPYINSDYKPVWASETC